VTNWSCFETCN